MLWITLGKTGVERWNRTLLVKGAIARKDKDEGTPSQNIGICRMEPRKRGKRGTGVGRRIEN